MVALADGGEAPKAALLPPPPADFRERRQPVFVGLIFQADAPMQLSRQPVDLLPLLAQLRLGLAAGRVSHPR